MPSFVIGAKIRDLRIKNGLTQEELANRCELSKGFISQLESEQTSPSIATLADLLECLGSSLPDFFSDHTEEQIVFGKDDCFAKESPEEGHCITWLVPNCQKNDMEPIIMEIEPGGSSPADEPHAGEEFGYVLAGTVVLHLGEAMYKAKRGESFYFKPDFPHHITNPGKIPARILWVASPPSF